MPLPPKSEQVSNLALNGKLSTMLIAPFTLITKEMLKNNLIKSMNSQKVPIEKLDRFFRAYEKKNYEEIDGLQFSTNSSHLLSINNWIYCVSRAINYYGKKKNPSSEDKKITQALINHLNFIAEIMRKHVHKPNLEKYLGEAHQYVNQLLTNKDKIIASKNEEIVQFRSKAQNIEKKLTEKLAEKEQKILELQQKLQSRSTPRFSISSTHSVTSTPADTKSIRPEDLMSVSYQASVMTERTSLSSKVIRLRGKISVILSPAAILIIDSLRLLPRGYDITSFSHFLKLQYVKKHYNENAKPSELPLSVKLSSPLSNITLADILQEQSICMLKLNNLAPETQKLFDKLVLFVATERIEPQALLMSDLLQSAFQECLTNSGIKNSEAQISSVNLITAFNKHGIFNFFQAINRGTEFFRLPHYIAGMPGASDEDSLSKLQKKASR